MLNVVWDMETGDPDDFLTLVFLCGHPQVHLRAVTVTPGGADQVGVVRWVLDQFGLDIPVGAFWDPAELARNDRKNHGRVKNRVSRWHYRTFGEIPHSEEAEAGWQVLRDHFDAETTLITGGPLRNLGRLIAKLADQTPAPELGRLVAQGGFAGEGVVPPDNQLEKFKGMVTCPTYNLNGDYRAALAILQCPWFTERRFVSKNVCHGVVYDQELHSRVQEVLATRWPEGEPDVSDKSAKTWRSLTLIRQGMAEYLRRKPEGKKFHDPLAACCALDSQIGQWAEVDLYREKGKWGSRLKDGTGTQIIVSYDRERFLQTLLAS